MLISIDFDLQTLSQTSSYLAYRPVFLISPLSHITLLPVIDGSQHTTRVDYIQALGTHVIKTQFHFSIIAYVYQKYSS